MARTRSIALLLLFLSVPLRATEVSVANSDTEETQPGSEDEDKGILPEGGVIASTGPITPVSQFPEKAPYDQARDELAEAQALRDKGALEAASDAALEAYEDLLAIRRHKKKNRKKIHAERYQAATLYIETGIGFINEWVKSNGGTAAAIKEGQERLEDLRDVARDYPDLNHRLNKAVEALSSKK